jgi:hypothetical protein
MTNPLVLKIKFLIWSIIFLLFALNSYSQPKAQIQNNHFKFGSVTQGSVVEHKFEIQNIGNEPLLVHSVETSCGCTAAIPPGGAILPGSSAAVTVAFDTSGFSGAKEKTVIVFTNDPEQKDLLLKISGEVQVGIEFSPKRIDVGEVRKSDSSINRIVYISIPNDSEKELLDVVSNSEAILIKDKTIQPKSGQFSVEFTPSKATVLGNFLDKVFIKTKEDNKESIYVIPLTGKLIGNFNIEPKVVSLGLINSNSGGIITKTIKITSPAQNNFQIKQVVSQDPIIKTSIRESMHGYFIDITVNSSEVKKDIQSSISVVTSDPVEPNLGITVYGYLPPKN